VHIEGLDETSDDACYRAMDQLLAIEPVLAEQAYYQVTDLLNLEVDLLFFDTTSTYFEVRASGKSRDSRDDFPHTRRPPARGQGEDQDRGEPRRQVAASITGAAARR
jgi:hypothetical protein